MQARKTRRARLLVVLVLLCLLLLLSLLSEWRLLHHSEVATLIEKINSFYSSRIIENEKGKMEEIEMEAEVEEDGYDEGGIESNASDGISDDEEKTSSQLGANTETRKYDFGTERLRPARRGVSQRGIALGSSGFADPVVEDAGIDFLPFDESFVNPVVKSLPRIELEVDYLRFVDEFGLINSMWEDKRGDEILMEAMQRLINIWAQANIRLRIRRDEIGQRVQLSRFRALAYWYYVDWPRGDLTKSLRSLKQKEYKESKNRKKGEIPTRNYAKGYEDIDERYERRMYMQHAFGDDFLFERIFEINKERQGLLDWILGWPAARTPWEVQNGFSLYQSFYYMYLNGGGEPGAVRFRTGDCKTRKVVPPQLHEKDPNSTEKLRDIRCLGFDQTPRWLGLEKRRMVRSFEVENFTMPQAVRLMAHELGHALHLSHPYHRSGSSCKYYKSWKEGELMSQVRSIAIKDGSRCRSFGYPTLASDSTYIPPESIEVVRRLADKDLRQTPDVNGGVTIGVTTEQISEPLSGGNETGIKTIVFTNLPSLPFSGRVLRVRYKLFSTPPQYLILAVVTQLNNSIFQVEQSIKIHPQHDKFHIHYEHDINEDFRIRKGQYLALSVGDDDGESKRQILNIAQQKYQVHLMGQLPKQDQILHPVVRRLMHPIDSYLSSSPPMIKASFVWSNEKISSKFTAFPPIGEKNPIFNFMLCCNSKQT